MMWISRLLRQWDFGLCFRAIYDRPELFIHRFHYFHILAHVFLYLFPLRHGIFLLQNAYFLFGFPMLYFEPLTLRGMVFHGTFANL